MTLQDVKIGQKFRFKKNQLVWIKETEQGMNKHVSYCKTEKTFKTRSFGIFSHRNSLFKQSTEIFETL